MNHYICHQAESLPDLEARVRQFLHFVNRPSLRQLDVQVEGNTVVLNGRVRTFHEKQMATEFARRVAGVVRVVNLVDVYDERASSDIRREQLPKIGHGSGQ